MSFLLSLTLTPQFMSNLPKSHSYIARNWPYVKKTFLATVSYSLSAFSSYFALTLKPSPAPPVFVFVFAFGLALITFRVFFAISNRCASETTISCAWHSSLRIGSWSIIPTPNFLKEWGFRLMVWVFTGLRRVLIGTSPIHVIARAVLVPEGCGSLKMSISSQLYLKSLSVWSRYHHKKHVD